MPIDLAVAKQLAESAKRAGGFASNRERELADLVRALAKEVEMLRAACDHGIEGIVRVDKHAKSNSSIPAWCDLWCRIDDRWAAGPYGGIENIYVFRWANDRLTPLLIARGLVKGITPTSIRRACGVAIPAFVSCVPDGDESSEGPKAA